MANKSAKVPFVDGHRLLLVDTGTTQNGETIYALGMGGSGAGGGTGIDQTTEGTTNRVVAGKATVLTVTPVLDTSAYTANDVLFAETEIANAVRAAGLGVTLTHVIVIDKDDEGAQMTLYFWDADSDFGTINTAPNISDANAAKLLAIVDIATTDYKDVGGAKVANVAVTRSMAPATGTSIWVSATTTGTPTYTGASDIVLRIGVLQD